MTRRHIGLLSIIGVFGSFAVANAQAPAPSAAGTPFDGTYRLVSSTSVNPTYMSYTGHTGQCPNRRPGPLHIASGSAHYMTATGYRLGGTVGAQGELAMAVEAAGGSKPLDLDASGSVDRQGTAHVRQRARNCNYDFVWRKRSK